MIDILHKSKNGIFYNYKKCIRHNRKIVGWHLYRRGVGMLGSDRFVGYLWKTKTGNAW